VITVPQGERRLSPADWSHWFATGHPTVVSHNEAEHFHRIVAPTPGMTAVDLACGTGQWTRQLAAWGLTVTGYDYCDEALRQAGANPRDGLSYARWDIVGDPIPPDLQPNSVDLVTCRYALQYLEPAHLLTDVGRWLKPDGTFYALVRLDPDDARPSPDADAVVREPFRSGFTEKQLSTLGAGWSGRQIHRLSRRHHAVVLNGYGRASHA
jgi:ubiquinone/menaquinone biosynthesis C-methylase UbiE